jgi:lauroyl/myristoyl acyltransferase
MLLDTEGGEGQRIAATTEAARILRGGGFTLLVVDGLGTAQVPATIFGRAVSLSAGAFALARLSDAPILPVAVRWHGGAVRITAGAPISPGEATEMAAALARWLETYLREHPGELTFTVAKLLRAAGTT